MSTTDQLLQHNEQYALRFDKGGLPLPPAKHLAIVACMDARLDVHKILGLQEGDAHVIRNAGGAVTDDVIRSLVISQRLLGTREIVLIHHTDCGMVTFRDDEVKRQIQAEVGIRPAFALEAFSDIEDQGESFRPAQERGARLCLRREERSAARGQLTGGRSPRTYEGGR